MSHFGMVSHELFNVMSQAAIGIAELLVTAMIHEGKQENEARNKVWLIDKQGLLVQVGGVTLGVIQIDVNSISFTCYLAGLFGIVLFCR